MLMQRVRVYGTLGLGFRVVRLGFRAWGLWDLGLRD